MIPIVSICIPVYNGAKWLRACLDSALATELAIEIVVNDDRSSDQSLSIAREYMQKDARVKVYQNEVNLGLVGNWNKCIELSTGAWIKFLFQDDRLQPGALEKMYDAAESDVKLIAAKRNYVFTDNSSQESFKYYTELVTTLDKVAPGKTSFGAEDVSKLCAKYISLNFIGEPSTVMFHRSVISEIGQFNTSYRQICDLEFWIRIGSNYGMVYVPDAVIDFTVHDDSESAKNANQRPINFDALIFVAELCYGENYKSFRNYLSFSEWQRLVIWLRVHAYEARMSATEENKKELSKLFAHNERLYRESKRFGNGLLYKIVRAKRN